MIKEIYLKRGSGVPSSLKYAEPAVDMLNRVLYIGATHSEIGGSDFIKILDENAVLNKISENVEPLEQDILDIKSGKSNATNLENGTGTKSIEMTNSVALGDYSFAEGSNTRTGQKGFLINATSSENNTYTLSGSTDLSVGDVISIRAGENLNNLNTLYFNFGTITAIDTSDNTITVDEYREFSEDVGYLFVVESDAGDTVISGNFAHAEGHLSVASGDCSHAEGDETTATGDCSHAEGDETTASGAVSHAEGFGTTAIGDCSHAEGERTIASGVVSHAEGERTIASGVVSHAEGEGTIASGVVSHAEGNETTASGDYSHAEGNGTTASGNNSHAEGMMTTASEDCSHAEGAGTTASGVVSHAEGNETIASGDCSHAEGDETTASGVDSHSEGTGTIAAGNSSHVQGKYNISDNNGTYAHIVGNGTANNARSNAHTVDWDGNGWFAGKVTVGENGEELITVSDALENLCPSATVSAENSESLTITDGLSGTKLKECTVYGTEEGVGDYNSTTQKYDIPITVKGKNLLNLSTGVPFTSGGLTLEQTDGINTGYTYEGRYYVFFPNTGFIKTGEHYILNGSYSYLSNIPSGSSGVLWRLEYDENPVTYSSAVPIGKTLVSAKKVKRILIYNILVGSSGTITTCVISNLQLRKVSDDYTKAFEPYATPQNATLSLDEPLYEGDSVSLSDENKKLTLLSVPTNIIEIGTIETPSEISVSYYQDVKVLDNSMSEKINNIEDVLLEKSNATNLVNGSGIGSLKSVSAASADGIDSFAEGEGTTASGNNSHAEGMMTTASEDCSHAEGNETIASGVDSHSEGTGTIAAGNSSHVQGKYNISDNNGIYAHIVGNGTANNARSNAHTVDWDGNGWFAGKVTVGENGEELITVSDALENLCPHTTVSAENSESLTITDGLSGTKLKECTVYGTEEGVGDLNSETGKYDIPITIRSRNLLNTYGFSAQSIGSPSGARSLTNIHGTTISTTDPSNSITVTQSRMGSTTTPESYANGYLHIGLNDAIQFGKQYRLSFDLSNLTKLPSAGSRFALYSNGVLSVSFSVDEGRNSVLFTYRQNTQNPTQRSIELRIEGMSFTMSDIMITESDDTSINYEAYCIKKESVLSLDAPLYEGESASLSEEGERLTVLPVKTNIIEVGTEETPSKIEISYYRDINSGEVFAPLDKYGQIPDEYIKGKTVKEYGVRWNGTSQTTCVRLGDAEGLTANAHKGSTDSVENDFDSIYPWSDIRLCNVDSEGNILAYIGEPTFKRDGTNGDVMVEIPKFYYKRTKTGTKEEWWICGVKLPGYELHPLFINDGQEVSKVFHSAYNVSSYTDETDNKVKLQSISGVQPQVRTTRANFRTYARNKGENWGIEDLSCIHALQMLYMVEYANTNSQSALGAGADGLYYGQNHKALVETTEGNTITISSAYENVYKIGQRIEIGTSQGIANRTSTPRTITAISTDDETERTTITFDGDAINISVNDMMWNAAPLNGSCDDLNGKSGWLAGENNYTNHYADVNYRGIEGFHAKLNRYIDGINIKNRVVYYANSMEDYANGVYDGAYRAIGYTNGSGDGYISAFGYDEKAPWVMLPVSVSASPATSSSTYIPDYYYGNTGERLLLLGGNWSDGVTSGAFFFNCSISFANESGSCGAHIIMKKA